MNKFIQQAYKGKNDWYLYLITFFLVVIGWQLIGIIPLVVVAIMHSKDMGEFAKAAGDNFMSLGINPNLFLFLMIFMFAMGLWALYLCVKFIHKRTFTSLVTSRKKIDWKRILFAFMLWGLVSTVFTFYSIFTEPEMYQWNFKPEPFFTLVAISFLFLPLQTSFEELFFRGYLMQGFGLLFKNALIPLLLTATFFGLLHGANPEVEKLGMIMMVYYIGTGLLLGIMTLMDEGTELAIGFHAANNIFAAIWATSTWTVFQTDALYIDTSEPSVGFELFFPVLVIYPILLFIFSKKYGWTNWFKKLVGRIERPIAIQDDKTSFLEV